MQVYKVINWTLKTFWNIKKKLLIRDNNLHLRCILLIVYSYILKYITYYFWGFEGIFLNIGVEVSN